MPAYNTNTNPFLNVQTGAAGAAYIPVLTPGKPITLWNNETPAPGTKSQQFSMHRDGNLGQALSVEIVFAADPGAFEVELLTADTDAAANYVKKTSVTTDNASFVARIEITGVVANFACLNMKTRTNSVACTAKVF